MKAGLFVSWGEMPSLPRENVSATECRRAYFGGSEFAGVPSTGAAFAAGGVSAAGGAFTAGAASADADGSADEAGSATGPSFSAAAGLSAGAVFAG